MIKIDDIMYDVDIVDLDLDVEFIYKYAERLSDGTLHSEISSVFFNQSITFGKGQNNTDFMYLFNKLSELIEYHAVEIYTPAVVGRFNMYCSNVKLKMIKEKLSNTYWEGMTVKFIACNPVRSK